MPQPRLLTLPALLVLAASSPLLSCGGDDGAGAGGDAGPPAGDAGDTMGAAGACTGCAANQGCLQVSVGRTAADAELPWKLFPDRSDGVGTLIVAATAPGKPPVRKAVASADFRAAGARREVDLGCVPAGPLEAWVFLDDDGDVTPDATNSTDFLDACIENRAVDAVVTAGQTTRVTALLSQSCD